MATTTSMAPPRLPARWLMIALAGFAAVSAVAGGVGLALNPHGSPWLPPVALLGKTPFTTFVGPGILLAVVVGGSALGCAILWWRRARGARDLALLAGGALSFWILAQVAMIQAVSWLHVLYGAVGLGILVVGGIAAWGAEEPRPRWVARVTLVETLGFLAPATAGILLTRAGIGGGAEAAVVVAAGLVEGLVLGAGQAFAFPFPVRRLRFAGLTALGAAGVWGTVMVARGLFEAPAVAVPAKVALGVAVGVVGLAAIGGCQWLELRRRAPRAWRWIPVTALAWLLALPLSFAPGPFVDETTPLAAHLALWGTGGALMAYVMALVTWQGVRRLASR